jgi:hypothetical protein
MVLRAIAFALVALLSVTLHPLPSAGAGRGASQGGWHGGAFDHGAFRGGFHRGQGFGRFDCCFAPVLLGNAFLDAADAAAYYDDNPYPGYPAPPPDVPAAPYQASPPPPPPIFCYVGGCYHLQGNGVNVPYQWVWVPDPSSVPPPPPAAPKI